MSSALLVKSEITLSVFFDFKLKVGNSLWSLDLLVSVVPTFMVVANIIHSVIFVEVFNSHEE